MASIVRKSSPHGFGACFHTFVYIKKVGIQFMHFKQVHALPEQGEKGVSQSLSNSALTAILSPHFPLGHENIPEFPPKKQFVLQIV